MNAERKSLMETAAEKNIKIHKFWSTEKLAKEVNAGIVAKAGDVNNTSKEEKSMEAKELKKVDRSEVLKRSWESRRLAYGPTGLPESALLNRRAKREAKTSGAPAPVVGV